MDPKNEHSEQCGNGKLAILIAEFDLKSRKYNKERKIRLTLIRGNEENIYEKIQSSKLQ